MNYSTFPQPQLHRLEKVFHAENLTIFVIIPCFFFYYQLSCDEGQNQYELLEILNLFLWVN